jgi:hypothetical protein
MIKETGPNNKSFIKNGEREEEESGTSNQDGDEMRMKSNSGCIQ